MTQSPSKSGGLDNVQPITTDFTANALGYDAQYDPPTISTDSLNETARMELHLVERSEAMLDHHYAVWRGERDKISNLPNAYPDFDLGARPVRNLMDEYDERRFVWEQKREAIITHAETRRTEIREAGHTLSDEFAGAMKADASAPEATHAPAPSNAEMTTEMTHETTIRESYARYEVPADQRCDPSVAYEAPQHSRSLGRNR